MHCNNTEKTVFIPLPIIINDINGQNIKEKNSFYCAFIIVKFII